MNGDNQRRGQPMAMRNQIQDHALIPGVPGKQGKQGECRSIWKERVMKQKIASSKINCICLYANWQ